MFSVQEEIGKCKPFGDRTHEAILSIALTADRLARPVDALLANFELSRTQYNVLRILRGIGDGGLPCGQIAQCMVSRDPDMTRLLDRLLRRNLIARCREESDRRVVRAHITDAGVTLLARIDEPLTELHRRQMQHVTEPQLTQLIELLAAIRGGLSGADAPTELVPCPKEGPI